MTPENEKLVHDGHSSKRTFDTGATRDTEAGKLDFDGFLSVEALERYAEYLNGHRTMSDGSTRASDNWKNGIPLDVYMKSAWRHFFAWWKLYRSPPSSAEEIEEAICGLLFNANGFLHEFLTAKNTAVDKAEDTAH